MAYGLHLMVYGLWLKEFRVYGSGCQFRGWCSGFGVQSFEFEVSGWLQSLEFRSVGSFIQGSGYMINRKTSTRNFRPLTQTHET